MAACRQSANRALPAPSSRRRAGCGSAVFADARLQPRWIAEAFAERRAHPTAPRSSPIGVSAAAARRTAWRRKSVQRLRPVGVRRRPAASRWTSWPSSRRAGCWRHRSATCSSSTSTWRSRSARSTRRRSTAWRALGVWRFQVDGAAEVAAGEPLTASALAVRLAAGAVPRLAYQSWSRTDPLSVSRNRAALLQKTAQFPLRALREAQPLRPRVARAAPAGDRKSGTDHDFRIGRAQGNRGLSLISIGSRILRRGVEKALAIEQWSLAFSFEQRDPDPAARRASPASCRRPDRDWSEPVRAGEERPLLRVLRGNACAARTRRTSRCSS